MAEMRVTYANLRSTADTIREASKEFRSTMGEVETTMSSLKTKWESDAADGFHAQFNKLIANFDAYEKVINQYSMYLEKTATEYEQVDKKIQDETAKLDGSALFV